MTNSEFDLLQLYFGVPYVINTEAGNNITIHQPSIGDIIDRGEQTVYSGVNIFVANPTMYRLPLWKQNIDWNKINDFQLFCILYDQLDIQSTELLFGDLNFQLFKFDSYTLDNGDKYYYLYNEEQDVLIDENIHSQISNYIRFMFNYFPKTEKAKGKSTKEWIIQEDEERYELHKNDPYQSTLLPLISSCLNHPGFKYKKKELRNVGIVEFMDSVQRLQIYESSTALLKGVYSGFVDGSKLTNKEELNFMREISR